MPVAILLCVQLYQRHIARDLPPGSALVAALYALLAIAGTHDWFAWQSARLAAIHEVRASGVPRYQIQGGFEYDGWTQIENGGHINYGLIRVPAGAFNPHPKVPNVAPACQVYFAPYTPAVQPVYSVVFPPKPCLDPSRFPPVAWRAWLPPFHRTIYVQKIPGTPDVPDPGDPQPHPVPRDIASGSLQPSHPVRN